MAEGYREIEFIVQSHQYLQGAQPSSSDFQSLRRSREIGSRRDPPAEICETLRQHYEFLRTVEHRLQILDDRQTHTLPGDAIGLNRIAHASGFKHPDALLATLSEVTRSVHQQFGAVFRYEENPQGKHPGRAFEALWRSAIAEDGDPRRFKDAGFREPEKIIGLLAGIPCSRFYQAFSREGRERLDRLMPAVLSRCAESEDPDAALTRVTFVIQSIGRRSAYLAMLLEKEWALSQLVKLACASAEVSQWIAASCDPG